MRVFLLVVLGSTEKSGGSRRVVLSWRISALACPGNIEVHSCSYVIDCMLLYILDMCICFYHMCMPSSSELGLGLDQQRVDHRPSHRCSQLPRRGAVSLHCPRRSSSGSSASSWCGTETPVMDYWDKNLCTETSMKTKDCEHRESGCVTVVNC